MSSDLDNSQRWYEGITRYQWLVLIIASLGWVFDVFEGQIFVASMNKAMGSLTPADTPKETIDFYNKIAFAAFLIGGAIGGIGFGMLSDRIGRTKTMIYTILMYSCFTFVTVFAQTWWHMVGLRFLVAMGVGGEWAVATAMVAEVFPKRARASSLGIFHASSVLGTYLAVAARWLIIEDPQLSWRWGFVIGVLPALLTIWIRWRLHEPERWVEARDTARNDQSQQTGQLADLFAPGLLRNSLIGLSLAAIGLATFWGVHVYGKDVLRHATERHYLAESGLDADASGSEREAVLADYSEPIERSETLGMFLTTTGGGIGLLLFGPLCERLGRRGAFLWFHLGGFAIVWLLLKGMPDASPQALLWILPIFGFLTLGMHAGYAIYFPELFPTRLRGTGGGFCFNGGRVAAAGVLALTGFLGQKWSLSLEQVSLIISLLFLVGAALLVFAPETRGTELQD